MDRQRLTLSALGAAALLAGGSVEAQPQECASDADCGHGYVCETGTTACPEIAILCVEGEKCEQPACEPGEYAMCVLAPCEQDSDCPDNLTCAARSYEQCDWRGASCQEGQPCEQPEPTNCREVTERYCAPPWELQCEQDADCGEGFRCIERLNHWCNGSDGGEEPAEPDCGSEPSGEYYCEQQEIPCESDAQCPAMWSCSDNPVRPVCASSDGQDVACGSEDQPEKVCMPPTYNRGGLGGVFEVAALGDAATSTPAASSAAASGAPSDGAQRAGESEPSGMGPSAGSCQVGAGAGSSFGWLALALGLLLLRRRGA